MATLQKQERKSGEQDDILALVDEVLSDMRFVGFDIKAFRLMLGKEGWAPKQIVVAISLYCQIGNNVQNITKKRASELKQYGKDVIAKLKTGVTLPRIAISFAPLTLAIRTRGVANGSIQSRFAINVPDNLQDAALVCYMTKEQYAEWNTSFSEALRRNPRNRAGNQEADYYSVAARNLKDGVVSRRDEGLALMRSMEFWSASLGVHVDRL